MQSSDSDLMWKGNSPRYSTNQNFELTLNDQSFKIYCNKRTYSSCNIYFKPDQAKPPNLVIKGFGNSYVLVIKNKQDTFKIKKSNLKSFESLEKIGKTSINEKIYYTPLLKIECPSLKNKECTVLINPRDKK